MSWTETDVVETLKLLRPQPCPVRLVRLGGEYDGAYLVPDDLEGVIACFSPGVDNTKTFEDDLAALYGIRSHLCDFSSDASSLTTPLLEGMQTFEKKWLDVGGVPDSISLDEWVARREPVGDLMLQMDIEGAEFRNILGASGETLRRFRVIVMEVHGVHAAGDLGYFSTAVGPLMRRLDEEFVCVHAHPNNCCGEVVHPATGMNLPGPIELTFLRRDRYVGVAPETMIAPSFPHPNDILRNVPGNPPLFLNAAWSDSPRSPQSRLKMEDDRLNYLRFVLSGLTAEIAQAEAARELAARAAADADLQDLSTGRPFRLSSALNGYPIEGTVQARAPFFFHTGFGRDQYITIDLGSTSTVIAIEIENRTDMCFKRIQTLSACFHQQPTPTFHGHVPLQLSAAVLTGPTGPQVTLLEPTPARFVTLFCPAETALHLAALRVVGRRQTS